MRELLPLGPFPTPNAPLAAQGGCPGENQIFVGNPLEWTRLNRRRPPRHDRPMRTSFRFLLLACFLASGVEQLGAVALLQDPVLPEKPHAYANPRLPDHFPSSRLENTPRNNPVTDHGATLGRVLFYDTRLSANEKISCASCHRQENAFADPRRLSRGTKGAAWSTQCSGPRQRYLPPDRPLLLGRAGVDLGRASSDADPRSEGDGG